MAERREDPRCPECGEPIGQTATYCMHCSADLTDGQATPTQQPSQMVEAHGEPKGAQPDAGDDELFAADSLVDNTLTVVVGVIGGFLVGLVGTTVLFLLTESGIALLFGVVVWLGATAYLVRRRTVQEAVSKAGYAVAVVLLLVPLVAVSPAVEGGISERGGLLFVLLLFVAIPAVVATAIGWLAGRFIPEHERGSEG